MALAFFAASCTETFDAGRMIPHGELPVDERNPIVLMNDNAYENWQGEYAVLLANGGGPKLVGIIVGTGSIWTDLEANRTGWRDLIEAARQGGLKELPDPIASLGAARLTRPASGEIDETVPNRSDGAIAIRDLSLAHSLPYRPLVLVTGTRLTDVADAYLIDNTVTDRVVVVSSLGQLSAQGATMGNPNGEMDPWADTIVTSRFRYVQVSAFYDSTTDVPDARVPELPADNPFAQWIAKKRSSIWDLVQAADQVAVAAVGIPGFATDVVNVGPVAAGAGVGPDLTSENPKENLWLVRQIVAAEASRELWRLLLDPNTFAP